VDLAPSRIPPQDGALRLGGQRRERRPTHRSRAAFAG